MRYRLVIHSRSDKLLPMAEDFDSAAAAARRRRELRGPRISAVSIYAIDGGLLARLSPARLMALAQVERKRQAPRRLRKAIASALLGMMASALPNAFGDFGVVSASGTARATRRAALSIRLAG